MRTNNSKVKSVIVSVYFVLIVLSIFFATVFSAFSNITRNPYLTFIIITLIFAAIFVILHANAKFFEYDSDGLKVVVVNRGLLLADYFNYREHKIEFNKDKIYAFKFQNYLFHKRLILYLYDRKGGKKKETFNVTFVTRKKRKYIRQSLSKMIKANLKSN